MWSPDPSQIITLEQREAEAREAAMAALRAERDRLLAETDKLMLRHADEVALELTPTLAAQQHADLIAYRQALRDLPENTTDPNNPEWPNEPTA